MIRHTCDVRCCVNPDHLVAGTQADNNADAVRRGRIARYALVGPNHWPALAYRLRAAARAATATPRHDCCGDPNSSSCCRPTTHPTVTD